MKKTLRYKMLLLTLAPLLILALVLGLVGYQSIRSSMEEQSEAELKEQCALLSGLLDRLYPGDYQVKQEGGSYRIYKGEYDLTEETYLFDNMKTGYGNEYTLFYNDTSVLTTAEDKDGQRAVLSVVSDAITQPVLEDETATFFSNVTLNNKAYFAYFEPIYNADGSLFGMYGIYQDAEDVNSAIRSALLPIALVYLIATVLLALITAYYSQHLVRRLGQIQDFMGRLAKGDFAVSLPEKFFHTEDEITDLARSGRSMQQSLRQLVDFDALTGLHNRRYANGRLPKSVEKSDCGKRLCLAIGDIDFFKKVNDTYGHDAGDEVLKAVAAQLKQHMTAGFTARWGGEEFLFAFENTELKDAEATLWGLLEDIRKMEVKVGEQVIKVTMSFGLMQADDSMTIDEMLKEADNRLYAAKTTGRNQVIARPASDTPGD